MLRNFTAVIEHCVTNSIQKWFYIPIFEDEVLCHRLGLLPIRADPRLFEMPLTKVIGINETGVDVDEEPAGDPKRFFLQIFYK